MGRTAHEAGMSLVATFVMGSRAVFALRRRLLARTRSNP
jgi:hypothetical protein